MNHTKTNAVLFCLVDRQGGSCPRDELCRQTGLNPAELDAVLRELAGRGHGVRSEPGGVWLSRPTALDAVLVERDLPTCRLGRSVLRFGEVSSTNDVAWDALQAGESDGLVVLAEAQRAGRGRLGRTWQAESGSAVLMSVVLAGCDPLPTEAVTISAGLAVAEAVEDVAGLHPELKWPNDVLLDGAKLAGVLVEARRVRQCDARVVGVGINVTAAPPEETVDSPACCLADRADGTVERIDLVRSVLVRLEARLDEVAAGQLDGLHDAWRTRCAMLHDRLRVRSDGRERIGRVLDVDPLEGLVLVDDRGTRHHLPAATTTVLG
jgi:BirA family transcriptional regulator, biotin operon repressor / biotin---[acetyl-CoA-carboxylase] ligase